MDRSQRGKKENQQDDFQKLLARPFPLHPKGKHTILECINLRKSLQERQMEEDKKKRTRKMTKIMIKMEPWDFKNLSIWST